MRTVRFGIMGAGVMGREFASAVSRWCHLLDMKIRPELVALCNRTLSPERIDWFTRHFPSIQQVTDHYQELLANEDVEAVYVALPHNLHQEVYCAALKAGKHLLGEKPFGIDLRRRSHPGKCEKTTSITCWLCFAVDLLSTGTTDPTDAGAGSFWPDH